MIKLVLIGNRVLSLVFLFCLLRKTVAAEEASTQKPSMTFSTGKNSEVNSLKEIHGSEKPISMSPEDIGKETLSEKDSVYQQTNRNFDMINDLFNTFLSFPFFPFHTPEQKKRRATDLSGNSSDEKEQIIGNRSRRISKPLVFIDFALNVEALPTSNQTNEENSPNVDESTKIYPREALRESVSKDISHVFDEDQSFLNDAPFPPQDLYDMVPKPQWLFFDFPFLGKEHKRNIGNKRNKSRKVEGSNDASFIDIFENAMSRMKREMEKTMPMQEFILNDEKSIPLEEKLGSFHENNFFQEPKTKWNEIDSVHSKSPILLGKIVKIRKIHFGDDYLKNKLKKKRRNSSSPKNKEKLRESSLFKDKGHKQGRIIRGTQDAKIMDLIAEWDRRMLEEQVEGRTPKMKSLKNYNDETEPTIPKDDKYFGQRETGENGDEFKMLKPQSSLRKKRQENDTRKGWENVITSKDEINKNITHFFSIIKNLGKVNNWYQGENQDMPDKTWPELGQGNNFKYAKSNLKKRAARNGRDADKEQEPSPVADLQFLFLTVTLPTTLALSLLLVACFCGLRPKSKFCQKIFQDRNVYVVEEDAEKGKEPNIQEKPEIITKEKRKSFKESRKRKNKNELKNNNLENVPDGIMKNPPEMGMIPER